MRQRNPQLTSNQRRGIGSDDGKGEAEIELDDGALLFVCAVIGGPANERAKSKDSSGTNFGDRVSEEAAQSDVSLLGDSGAFGLVNE